MQLLLAAGADREARQYQHLTPLHLAASEGPSEGHVAVLQVLLAAGADKEASDEQQATLLHFAAAGGYVAVMQVLLWLLRPTRKPKPPNNSHPCAMQLSKGCTVAPCRWG